MEKYIRNSNNRIVGSYEDQGNKIVYYDENRSVLGTYEKSTNYFRDKNYRIIADGDIGAGFVFSEYEKKH